MKAFELKKSIEELLDRHANGRYNVVSPQNRKSDAESIFTKPQVTVYYAEGSFDKSKSSVNSPYHHDTSFNIHLVTASKATVDVDTLKNPNATPAQYANALAETNNASALLDAKIDSLLSVLFDILMRPENRKLGTDYNTNRFIPKIKKYDIEKTGAIVIGGATITLTAQCEEEVSGEEAVQGDGVDTIVDLGDLSKQGVKP